MGEFELIKKLTQNLSISDPSVLIGFGDDCACVSVNGEKLLFTVDSQLENRHFIKDKISSQDLGWKLVSVNVSDVAACGGIPKWAVISIAVPKEIEEAFLVNVYRGIEKAKTFYKLDVIGGNTSSADEIIFDMFLIGKTERFVSRSGAKTQDLVFLSGYTGLSRAGLELLLMNKKHYEHWEKELIKFHTLPKARIDLSDKIQKYANSCIDISDGLVSDIGHIASMSRVSVDISYLPVHPLLERFCKKYHKDPVEYILYGGEDYQLVFTAEEKYKEQFNNCFLIGKVKEGAGVFLNGKPVDIKGFEHL